MGKVEGTLIALRKERGISQKEIADKIGVNEQTYRRKELGENFFNAPEMFIISTIFKEPVEKIFYKQSPRKVDRRARA